MSDIKNKLSSRKFWFAIAAFLVSVGTGISGIAIGDVSLAATGAIMAVIGGGIYQACEAYVDGKDRASNTTVMTTTVAANTSSKEAIEKMLSGTQASSSQVETKE